MTKEQELELVISCLHYLTDEDRKVSRENLGKLVKQMFIKEVKEEFPQYDKEWLEEDISVFVGTLRSDSHFGTFKAVSSYYKVLYTEAKFRIKETIIKDSRNIIYNLEMKWDDGSVENFLLVQDGTGYIREALDTDRDFIKRYKEPKSPNVKEIISNTVDETLNQIKDLNSTAYAIKKLVKDNNCFLVILGNTLYLKKADNLIELN